jgi:hypothetical protein
VSDSAITVTVSGNDFKVEPPFTNRELHIIKQVAGVRAGQLFEAMEAGDSDLLVALAHIAIRRMKLNRPSLDELWDLPAGDITVGAEEETVDAADPTPAGDESGSPATTP